MISIQAMAVNIAIRLMAANRPDGPKDYLKEREENADKSTVEINKGVICEALAIAGISTEKISAAKDNGMTVLYLHGGGFTSGSAKERRWLTQALAQWHGYTCIAPDYRLSPENKWPCHIEDCYAVYRQLLETGTDPHRLVLAGESAGGTLCLLLAMRLRDEGLTMPAGIVLFSPFTDQSGSLESHRKNISTDQMVGEDIFKDAQYEAVFREIPSLAYLQDPHVSPLYGDFDGLPPIFISASDTEVLYDDSALLYEKLKQGGHPVCFEHKHGLCHAWPTFSFLPETRSTLKKMHKFINDNIAGKGE
ncbi:MAG: alpha/beta hydrolase [Erysipelotrichaceae bacterium]|nr:alpha/beta hydrolase [Erysipelotrichaceae bacterium]